MSVHKSHKRQNKRQKRQRNKTHKRVKKGGSCLAKQNGAGCGCGASFSKGGSNEIFPYPPIDFTDISEPSAHMMGGGSSQPVQPSFSGLSESKFYPLNELKAGDPAYDTISSRNLPNTPIGMSSMKGGKKSRRKSRKLSKKEKRMMKKMKGGINMGSLLSQANGLILGNGMSDNIVANQGGINGVLTNANILNGNHNPTTSVSQPLNTLYSNINKPMI